MCLLNLIANQTLSSNALYLQNEACLHWIGESVLHKVHQYNALLEVFNEYSIVRVRRRKHEQEGLDKEGRSGISYLAIWHVCCFHSVALDQVLLFICGPSYSDNGIPVSYSWSLFKLKSWVLSSKKKSPFYEWAVEGWLQDCRHFSNPQYTFNIANIRSVFKK